MTFFKIIKLESQKLKRYLKILSGLMQMNIHLRLKEIISSYLKMAKKIKSYQHHKLHLLVHKRKLRKKNNKSQIQISPSKVSTQMRCESNSLFLKKSRKQIKKNQRKPKVRIKNSSRHHKRGNKKIA